MNAYKFNELWEMVKEAAETEKPEAIEQAGDAYKWLYKYTNEKQEQFIVMTLDGASRVIQCRVITRGTINQSLVHPREVFRDAILDNAAGIIAAHNHPSGSLSPSEPDRRVTRRLKEAGQLLGIDLLDHIIITPAGFYSFSEEGEI